jgi:hypothetical protein
MICLRCGYCCKNLFVVIVDDPKKGIVEDNLITHEGHNENCPHLEGDKLGEYSCSLHNETWYEDTPCFNHGQIERSPDTLCRMGSHLMAKRGLTNETQTL